MSDNRESLQQSVDYYGWSVQYNKESARINTGVAVGMGALAGMGVLLVVDGNPIIGIVATGIGGALSWFSATEAQDETLQAYKDEQVLEQYSQQLADLEASTEG